MKFINDRRRMRGQGGFTLIELLVVIAILGVLAGVVVFSVSGLTDRGQDSACEISQRTIKTAYEAFYAQATVYPTGPGAAAPNGKTFVPNFLESEPSSDTWTIDYTNAPAGAPTLTAGSKCI